MLTMAVRIWDYCVENQNCKENKYSTLVQSKFGLPESNFPGLTIRALLFVQVGYPKTYLIPNSWSVALVIFHFPEAMQHNFVLKTYNHSLE